MELHRKGEKGPTPYRTGRFFTSDSQWFFASREGIDHGPYVNKSRAEAALKQHIDDCQKVENRLVRHSDSYGSSSI